MLEPDDRDFGAAKELCRLKAAVAGDDLLVPVDQDWRIKAKSFDAPGDRADLLATMLARIQWVGLELIEREQFEPAACSRHSTDRRRFFLKTRFQFRIK